MTSTSGQVSYGSATGRAIVTAAVLGSGLTLLDGTVVNVALRTIGEDLDARPGPAAVDQQRLPADDVGPDPARWVARRPLRPTPDLRGRHHLVRRRFAALRPRPRPDHHDHRPHPPGHRRGDADARQPGDDPGRLRAREPCPGDRVVVRSGQHRGRRRAVRGRCSHRLRLVALDLPDQPAAGRPHRRDRRAVGAGDERPRRPRQVRRDRGGPRRRRARWHHLRPDRVGPHVRTVGGCHRRRHGDRLPARRTPRPAADDAARPVPRPHLQRRQRDDAPGVRRPGRGAVLPGPAAPDRRGLRRPQGRSCHDPDHHLHAVPGFPRRRPRPAHRPADPDDRRPDRDGARLVHAAAGRPRRELLGRGAARADALRARPLPDGGAPDGHRAGRGARRERRHRQRHQQRRGPSGLAAGRRRAARSLSA